MIKKTAVYLLSLCLLVASIPVEVYVHTCRLFGHTDVSLFAPVACCSEEAADRGTTALDVNCCSVSHEVLTSEVRSGELTTQPNASLQLIAVLCSWVYTLPGWSVLEHTSVPEPSQHGPPYASNPIYLRVQTFLI